MPKTSAAQGLRAVLNSSDGTPRVVATRGEFDSLDVVLREYARRGRIALALVEPRADGRFDTADVLAAVVPAATSSSCREVVFTTGQRLDGLPDIVAAAHAQDARVLVDVYHSLGVLPQETPTRGVDFAVGGCYKYLRGGPGACFLYVHRGISTRGCAPSTPAGSPRTRRSATRGPDPPRFAAGGDGWLESTPPVLPFYQARAGQLFVQSVGVERLRAHSLARQRELVDCLAAHGIAALGGTEDRGAFVVVRDPRRGGARRRRQRTRRRLRRAGRLAAALPRRAVDRRRAGGRGRRPGRGDARLIRGGTRPAADVRRLRCGSPAAR